MSTGRALSVLLVDDSADDRTLAQRAIRRDIPNTEFVEPLDAAELEQALERPYDVVLTDYRLGWSTGLQVLDAVQSAQPGVPVVMFTNTGSEEVCAEGLRRGLYDYLIKRSDQYAKLPQVLMHAVRQARQAAELRRHREELERRQAQLSALLARESAAREEAERARAEAQRANRLKDEFLATLSHELRTPLTAILGWSQVLLRKTDDKLALQRGLDAVLRNARAQSRLIEDLLDMSRIVSGGLRLEPRPVGLTDAAQAALESARPAAQAAGVQLEAALDPDAGEVNADPARLQQVVSNLLSNAIKFTPPGGRVQLRTHRTGLDAEIRVADTGCGIDPDFLPHVFDGFRQADGSPRRRHQGLGLGLTIVKRLTELQGGSVRAASDGPGRGAQFAVRLPLATPGSTTASRPAHAPASLAGLAVLVVDDDPDTRAVLAQMLQDAGAAVRLAVGADDALVQLQAGPPDVLLSDIGMPDKDGYQLIAELRAGGGPAAAVPAAALTAFARAEDRQRALQAGFDAHATKPVEPAHLLTLVARLAAGQEPTADG